MPVAHSKLTAQGQVSVPADVRRRLGLGPGSVLEWTVDDEQVIVRRAGCYSSQEIHQTLFPAKPPPRRTIAELNEGVRKAVRKRHARR